ncbi:MAG TPA: hypothetical protein VF250_08250 [Conexibacter sp.]
MRPLTLVLAVLAAAVLPGAAGAAPAVNGVFNLPARPKQLALGPDGNVWITLEGTSGNIARVRPDGTVDSFTSAAIVSPIGIVAGPDGQLWVTESGAVAHFSPSDPSAARRVDVAGLAANRIVVGSDGNLWTGSGDAVVRIRADETFTSFRPTGLTGAKGIAAGGDGNLYVADFLGRQVVGVSTAGVATDVYPLAENPQEVAAGAAEQIAVTMPSNLIGRFTPPSRTVQNANVPLTDPTGIAFAPDGAYWAANFPRDTLTRMKPDGAVTTLTGFPSSSGPRHLTVGKGGTLWVGLETSSQVARVTGVVAPTPPPPGGVTQPRLTRVSTPAALRVGRSGTLRLTLSEDATVRIRFERKLPGRRTAGGRCVRPRRAPHGRRCKRFKRIGAQTRAGVRGPNRLAIGGRIGRRTIPAGRYRLTITAGDAAGNVSRPVRRTLTVTSRRSAARRP